MMIAARKVLIGVPPLAATCHVAKPANVRVREHRRRQRLGLVLYQVEADEYQLVNALIDAGLVGEAASSDLAAVEGAIEALLARWIAERRSKIL